VEAAVADQLEIEQKFDVDEDFQRPDFGALGEILHDGVTAAAPVLHQLAATYFDTPDERLAVHKITLRRRTGGTDAGWHLKVPAGLDARRELREPLDGGEVPARLAATVAEITGGLPLAPIAVLETERTVVTLISRDGRVLAEVADDRVTARRLSDDAANGQPLRWREIEVEVPSAAPARQQPAPDLLRAPGARPAPHGSKLARLLNR
jgi:inorganic triphosphatase YgiF